MRLINKERRWVEYLIKIFPDGAIASEIIEQSNDKWSSIKEASNKLIRLSLIEHITIPIRTFGSDTINFVNEYKIKDKWMGI